MNHNGFKYQEGLNIDTIPFDPTGTCRPGGLYYSSEDIFAFLDYGDYIAEVEIPEDAQVYEDPSRSIRKWKADKIILKERKVITERILLDLIEEGASVNVRCNYILQYAHDYGHNSLIALLEDEYDLFYEDEGEEELDCLDCED